MPEKNGANRRQLWKRNRWTNRMEPTGEYVSTESEEPPAPEWFDELSKEKPVQKPTRNSWTTFVAETEKKYH